MRLVIAKQDGYYRVYSLRERKCKERQKEAEKSKQEAYKRKLHEIRTEEKSLKEKQEQLKTEHTAAQKAMEKTMRYVEEGGQKINNGFKANDVVEVHAGNKLIEFGRQQQCEANKKLSEISGGATLRVCLLVHFCAFVVLHQKDLTCLNRI